MDTWTIREADLKQHEADVLSTLFCVGNGASTTRGTLSEERFGAYRGVYLSGLYTRAPWGLVYYMGGPDWLPAFVRIDGKMPACVSSERQLDMRPGVLTRTATFCEGSTRVQVIEERFASFADSRVMCQRFSIMVAEGDGAVEVMLGLDGEVRNHKAKYYQPGQFPAIDETGLKLSRIESLTAGDGLLSVALRARSSEACAVAHARVRQSGGRQLACAYDTADGRAMAIWQVDAQRDRGTTFVFEKVCLLTACSDIAQASAGLDTPTFETALAQHLAAMGRFWELADVRIEGDDETQQSVRFAIWSTRIAAPDDGGRSSVGAKNLTGDWYRGAVFWDMEMFQLPMLAAIAPERARNHVLYRANRLQSARTLAAQDGYDGARYPWHSFATGLEEPPQLGGFLYQQQHVNLAVAWGIFHYHNLTGDDHFMLETGLEVLVELCRFWASRVTAKAAGGKYHIAGVCGPDENHPNCTDNTYTNRMVIWLINATQRLLDHLANHHEDALVDALDALHLDTPTIERWRDVAENLCVPMAREGVLAVCQGYSELPEPDDKLEAQGLGNDKRSKQADTLMLFQAIPEELPPQMLEACWREYAPLCHQASSLSLSTHALLAIRQGLLRDGERFFRMTTGADLADKMGNTRDGIHGAAQGGIWMATVWGFGGLRIEWDRIVIEPALPPRWKSLSYQFLYRGQPIAVRIRGNELEVVNNGDGPIPLHLPGGPVTLAPKQTVTRPHQANWKDRGLQAVIFDLDGVMVSTDRFHYQAWKELADELGIPFDEKANHALRGVSRENSLKLIYGDRPLPNASEFQAQCDRKNARYVELVNTMTAADVLPGSVELLESLRAAGIKIGIASASRNCVNVLERTGLMRYIDAIADGNNITASKPDPQVFYIAAQRLRCLPWNCIGVEDAATGVEAIRRAGMVALGIGSQATAAEVYVDRIGQVTLDLLRRLFAEHTNPLDPYTERSVAHIKREMAAGYAASIAFGRK